MQNDSHAPSPSKGAPLAYENRAFLNSPDGRAIRILAEYSEPLARFRRERIQDTIVFFGSARFFPPPDDCDSPASGEPGAAGHAAAEETARYCQDARRLAFMLTRWTRTLKSRRHRFVVTSGGGPGIMEAANRGAAEAGGKTIGLNIRLPFEQTANPYITPALNFEFHYFFMRKYWFAYLAKGLVVFPGGYGTLDELFELLTLMQTGKLAKRIVIVIYGTSYWKNVLNLDFLVEKGAISAEDRELFHHADTPEQAFAILQSELTRHHLAPEARSRLPRGSDDEHLLAPEIARTR